MEAKCSNLQTEREATLQLQTNMILLTSALLLLKVEGGEEITHMTSYGILMGLGYPLKVLKLNMDFEDGTLCFEQQFSISPSPMHAVNIDRAIDYIMEHL